MKIKRYDQQWTLEDGQELWMENDPQYINTQTFDPSMLSGLNLSTTEITVYEIENRLEVIEDEEDGDYAYFISTIKNLGFHAKTKVSILSLGVAAYETIQKDEDYSDHELIMNLKKENQTILADMLLERCGTIIVGFEMNCVSELKHNNDVYAIVNGAELISEGKVILKNVVTAIDLNKAKTPSQFTVKIKDNCFIFNLDEIKVIRNVPGGLTFAEAKVTNIQATPAITMETPDVPTDIANIEKFVEEQMNEIINKKSIQNATSFLDNLFM